MKTNSRRFSPRFVAALFAVSWSLALVFAPAQGRAAALTNILVNDPSLDSTLRDSQLETTIALGTGGSVFSAYVDTGSWDGTVGGVNQHLIGLSLSLDGGVTWMDKGTLPPTIRGDGMNPVLAFFGGVGALPDAVLLATTDFDQTGNGTGGIQTYKILDNGSPFVPNFMGTVAVAGGPPGTRIERPSLAVDNFAPPISGQGIVYLAWQSNAASIWLSRSIDGGGSFEPAIPVTPVDATSVAFTRDFNANDGGLTVTTPNPFTAPWTWTAGTWHVDDSGAVTANPKTSNLTTPTINVTQPGYVRVSFAHRHSFELEGGTLNDGGIVQVNVNGAGFTDVPATSFLAGSYNGTVAAASTSVNANKAAFVGDSAGYAGPIFNTSTIDLGFLNAGQTVAIRFVYGGNNSVKGGLVGPSWEITDLNLTQGVRPERTSGPAVVVGGDHAVYVFWLEQTFSGVSRNQIKVRRSTDNGGSFLTPTFPNNQFLVRTLSTANTNIDGDLRLQSGFLGNSFPRAIANQAFSPGLAVVYNDRGSAAADKADIYLSVSVDSGVSWSSFGSLSALLDDTGSNDQFNPSLAITPDGSRLFVGWYDRRRDTNNILIDAFGRSFGFAQNAFSSTLTLFRSFRITTESFPPVTDQDPGFLNPVLADYYMGSYDGAVADASGFYYTWSDNRLPHSSVGHPNQPDVRFSKIPIGGPGGILDLFHERQVALVNVGPFTITGGNGDSVIDFNERNNLAITLINRGNSNIVGIDATLQSLTPGVVVSPAVSFYPDIAAGGNGTSVTPFTMITPTDFVCGTIIKLQLTVTTFANGTFVIPFELNTGRDGTPTSFVYVDPPIPIPDGDSYRSSVINVTGLTAPISSVKVRAFLTHPSRSELDISLEGPDGTTIVLSSDNGADFDNYGVSSANPIIFDDTAATEIIQAPLGNNLAGSFRPEQRLAAFIGKTGPGAANGVWKLKVRDDATGNAGGLIQWWRLDIGTATCVDGGAGVGFLFAARTHVSGGNGNAQLDPNECANLSIVLTNTRLAAYTSVSGTLISQTPGVVVVQPTSAYPDIPGLEARANLTLFKVSIPASIPCGSYVKFLLKVSAFDELPFEVPVRLQVGTCASKSFAAVGPQVPLAIPDGPAGVVQSIIPVTGLGAPIGKVKVSVGIQHTYVRDLRLTLISPPPTSISVVLADDTDGGGDNFGTFSGPFTCLVPTTFDDAAGITVGDGAPPYAGAFMPVGSLFAFSGMSATLANGNWTLRVEDKVGIDVGQLICWSLSICEADSQTPVFGSLPSRIDDLNPGISDIAVPVSGITAPLNKVRVALRIRHTRVSDLQISLSSPDGTTVDLSSDNGGAGVNYGGISCAVPAVFDDDALSSITTAAAPFTAFPSYKPEQPLAAFAGKSGAQVNGTWTLRIVDHVLGGPAFGQLDCLLLDLFTADCTDGGGACAPVRTLTVDAFGSGVGVNITASPMDNSLLTGGITAFDLHYDNGVNVMLTAPLLAPNLNPFLGWRLDGVVHPALENPISFLMTDNREAVALYAVPPPPPPLTFFLTVKSEDPDHGVNDIIASVPDIHGHITGTTPFTLEYNNVFPPVLVTLIAPDPLPSGRLFKRWEIDENNQPKGQHAITVAMNANHEVEAEYWSATVELKVESDDPDSGVTGITAFPPDIHGNVSGTTKFTLEYPRNATVTMKAPPQAGDRLFKKWEVDDDDEPTGQRVVTFVVDEDFTVEAHYDNHLVLGTSFALWFDGFNDRVSVPDSASLGITTPLTVEAWINRDMMGVAHTIVDKSGCPGDATLLGGYGLNVNAADKLVFQTKDNCMTPNTVIGATSLHAGTWYHVAGVWDGVNSSVYVNGVLNGTVVNGNGPKAGNTALLIGSRGHGAPIAPFAGFIDDVRVWSVARSGADIAANQAACLTGAEPGLAAYWRLNEHDSIVAHDSTFTPTPNNGMLSGLPLWVNSTAACTTLPSPRPFISPRAAVIPAATLSLTVSPDMSGQACHVTVTSPPGMEVVVEVSGDMVHWSPLACFINSTGVFELADPMDPNAPKRFFRVREQP